LVKQQACHGFARYPGLGTAVAATVLDAMAAVVPYRLSQASAV